MGIFPFAKFSSFEEVANSNTPLDRVAYLMKPRIEGKKIAIQIHTNSSIFIQDENEIIPFHPDDKLSKFIASNYRNLLGNKGSVVFGVLANDIFYAQYARAIKSSAGRYSSDYNDIVLNSVDSSVYNYDYGDLQIRRMNFIEKNYDYIRNDITWSSNNILKLQKHLYEVINSYLKSARMPNNIKVLGADFYPQITVFENFNKLSFSI